MTAPARVNSNVSLQVISLWKGITICKVMGTPAYKVMRSTAARVAVYTEQELDLIGLPSITNNTSRFPIVPTDTAMPSNTSGTVEQIWTKVGSEILVCMFLMIFYDCAILWDGAHSREVLVLKRLIIVPSFGILRPAEADDPATGIPFRA